MKIDGNIGIDLATVAASAQEVEAAGYSGAWTAEMAHDPFLPLLLAAEHTNDLEIGTSIAVAFSRSPMTLANTAWDLQAYSKGRFVLGLGSQIKPHIEKRFSMEWSKPAARMREFAPRDAGDLEHVADRREARIPWRVLPAHADDPDVLAVARPTSPVSARRRCSSPVSAR